MVSSCPEHAGGTADPVCCTSKNGAALVLYFKAQICGKSPLRLPLKCLVRDWLRYVYAIVLELAARAGIGRVKPCGLIITAFAVIFVPDIVLLIVCVYLCRDIIASECYYGLQLSRHTGLNSAQK